jgi:hypothetical protein
MMLIATVFDYERRGTIFMCWAAGDEFTAASFLDAV